MTRSLSFILLAPVVLSSAFASLGPSGLPFESAGPSGPPTQEPSAAESHLGRMIGRWIADNPGAEGDDPVGWVYEVEWGDPTRRHFRGHLSAALDDGTERLVWSLYAFWHPAKRRVVIYQVHVDGTLVHGSEVIVDGAKRTAEMWFVQPDGTMAFLRHEIQIVDDDTHTTATLRLDESGEWQRLGTYTWHRDTSTAP